MQIQEVGKGWALRDVGQAWGRGLQRLQLGPCPQSEGPGLVLAAYLPLSNPPWVGAPSTPAHVSSMQLLQHNVE